MIVALNIGTGIITARALHPVGRGEQAAIILWPVLLSTAMTLGLPSALTYYIRRCRDTVAELAGAALALGLMVGIASALVAASLMPCLLPKYSQSVGTSAKYLLWIVPVGIVGLISRTILEAEGEFSVSMRAQWFAPSLTLIALLALRAGHRITPLSSAMAYTLPVIPTTAWLIRCLRQVTAVTFNKVGAASKLLLSYGLRSYGIDLCSTLAMYIDQALVVNMLSPRDMGVYVVALSISRMMNFSQAAIVMVLLPNLICLSPLEAVFLLGRAARFNLLTTLFSGLFLFWLSPIAIKACYGAAFVEATPVLRILLVEVTIAGIVTILAQAPMALGRPGITASLQASSLGLTIPFMILLVPRKGILGAAVALLATTVIRFILILVAFPVMLKIPVPRLWYNSDDLCELKDSFKKVKRTFVGLML